MKPAASILLVIWSLVMVQPVFAFFGGESPYGVCSKVVSAKSGCAKKQSSGPSCAKKKPLKPVCSTNKCGKPAGSPEKNDDCKTRGCNPSLGCSSGNFYVHYHYQLSFFSMLLQKQKGQVSDDNRLFKNMSECWHPPELIS